MREQELLDLWEVGVSASPAQRASRLAARVAPGFDPSVASIGARDAALLRFRRAALGDALEVQARCRRCGEHVEIGLSVADLLDAERAAVVPAALDWQGRALHFRVPSAKEVALAASARALAQACTPEASSDDLADGALVELIATSLAAADPLAEIELEVACPGCSNTWTDTLDVPTYVWTELDRAARSVLDTVARLARRYGWSEAEILAMSAPRRAWYLGAEAG